MSPNIASNSDASSPNVASNSVASLPGAKLSRNVFACRVKAYLESNFSLF
jgi:hypothetical protein